MLELVFTTFFGLFFIAAFGLTVLELVGKVYATYRILVREDLAGEQRAIFLGLVWLVPLGWLVYFVLGTEKTRELFSDLEFM